MDLRRNLFLLATGTLLNVVSQLLVSSYAFADKRAHVFPWIKYTATIVPAAVSRLRAGRQHGGQSGGPAPSPALLTVQQRTWLMVIGLLDILAYTLFSLAYFSCGAGLSNLLLAASAQVLTALSTRFLLKRRLNRGQWTGIGVIVTGLALRALPQPGAGAKVALQAEQWRGMAMIAAAACLYTAVGFLYEKLTKGPAKPPPHTEVMWHTSKLGFLLATGYQLLYTLPRFDSLVRQPMAANAVNPGALLPLLLAFATMFNLHMFAQSLVFRSDGAIGVGVVNSVRGAVLTVVTSALFCTPLQPWLCITTQSGVSAAVTTLGGVVWVLCDPKAQQPPAGKRAGQAQPPGADKDKVS